MTSPRALLDGALGHFARSEQDRFTSNQIETTEKSQERLSDVLFEREPKQFGNIAVVESNIQAVRACRLFVLGHGKFTAIVGPSGYGKSHLLEAVAQLLPHEAKTTVREAADWSLKNQKSEGSEPLILDNIQDAACQSKLRQNLRLGLDRRVKSGRRTLVSMTSQMPAKFARSLLPASKDWVVAQIQTPSLEDRTLIISQICQTEHLLVSPLLVRLLASRVKCSGRSYVGIVKRLKLTTRDWSDPAQTLFACGIINPFLSDDSGWDLREAIARVSFENRGMLPRNRAKDLALYLMLKVAQLSESSVSVFYNMTASEAFLRANSFAKTLPDTPFEREAASRIAVEVVEFLLQE